MPTNISFQFCFNVFCLLACISAIMYCIMTYMKDEDTTSMEFDPFDPKQDNRGYPSFSICILDPILETKLGQGIDKSAYLLYTGGHKWGQDMEKIDYDAVTVDLNENILLHEEMDDKFNTKVYNSPQETFEDTQMDLGGSKVQWAKKKRQDYHKNDMKPFFTNHRCTWGKCFGQNLPYDPSAGISKYTVWINMNIFLS